MDALLDLTAQMAREGIRRLLVLSGDEAWTLQQAQALRERLAGDGLWVGPEPVFAPGVAPGALKTLLGREVMHAFFDARRGFDVAALAALSGTLRAGSWLVLLTPPFADWPSRVDEDSLRWSDTPDPISTPHFVLRCCRQFIADPDVLLWRQSDSPRLPLAVPRPDWHPAEGHPLAEQAAILAQLLRLPPGIAAVTAERGRGKSALAGMLLRQLAGEAIVTAPTRSAVDVLASFAGEAFRFMAPDALLSSKETASWLIVDEAAAIPAPLLRQLVSRFPRTLLTTTVQGYEGTGRGFLLKFCASLPHLQSFSLSAPIRWAVGCPLESAISQLLIFSDEAFRDAPTGEVAVEEVDQSSWQTRSALPEAMYQLLSGAHYRTSPLDLRRMMDAPGGLSAARRAGGAVAGALWLVAEGDFLLNSAGRCGRVFAGREGTWSPSLWRRMAAVPTAATLRGLRVSRIAVHPARQREGLGQQMIADIAADAAGYDYLSVSFGYTPELWRFWQRCGFILVRLGTHREASSGCYTAMALFPLTAAGHQLAQREAQRLQRDEYWLRPWRDAPAPLPAVSGAMLSEEDWLEAASFAFAHRPLAAALGCLNRLLMQVDMPLPALRGRLQGEEEAELCAALQLTGRKALLARWRQEAADALRFLDAARAEALRQQVAHLQFF